MSSNFTLALTGQSLIKRDTRDVSAPGFEQVKSILRSADLSFTNFEGTILGRNGGWPLKGSFYGSSEPIVLDALKDIGFQAVALSNNHAFDLGPSGVLSTLEEVEGRGFLHSGIGRDQADAGTAGLGEVAGRPVSIVAMDGGPGPDFMYAANAGSGRPARPGVNRLRLTQVLEVDEPAFESLREMQTRIGYTRIDLTNDSQPDDPPFIADDEIGIARAIFKRSDRFGRSVKIDEEDLRRNLEAIPHPRTRAGSSSPICITITGRRTGIRCRVGSAPSPSAASTLAQACSSATVPLSCSRLSFIGVGRSSTA
ncbi:UNVERIFIED_ORG: poly-gamma-glutamate capsule biosynthesis protein CapA/YwtB (metallophosphatase superfamily) [Rhizobium nepotum]|jgi:poly-gamma-glutamate synthesis protein (capsule biosynthesis protein)|nr:poly-gamma-glutamate capsule biosynthesis protein CapA/YwtB (metallophosphatase superfamily) [Rhizobium nepotum]